MKALLLDALRGLYHRRGPTLVAAGGLMLAMTACVLVALVAIALSKPDPAIPDPDKVVVLDMKGNPPGQPGSWTTGAPMAFADMLKERRVPLELISRVFGSGIDIDNQGRPEPAYLLVVDPDLVPLLGLTALHGDLHATLVRHDGIAITPALARKLWGEIPMGQAIGRRVESRGTFYTVTAVVPFPDPRSPLGEANPMVGDTMAMVGYDSQGNSMTEQERRAIYVIGGRVLARLRPGASVDQVGGWMREAFIANPLYTQLPAEWRTGREAAYFRGIPLTQLPFEEGSNRERWRLLGAIGAASLLLLILASFNCMNLQTANLLQRQRETALRRCLGADGTQLVGLWGLEVLLPLLFAATAALLLAWWLTPGVAGWLGLPPSFPIATSLSSPATWGLGMTVVALVPLTLALPAWMALQRAPAPALQGRTASEGPWGRRIRQGLLALQLSGALLLLSLAGVLAVQQHYLLHADRGFDIRNRLTLSVLVNPDFVPNMDTFLGALGKHPAVQHWAFGSVPVGDDESLTELYASPSRHESMVRVTTVSPSYFATYGMTVLAGTPRTGLGEPHVVIDARTARLLGFSDPQAAIGALLRGGGGFMQEGNEPRRVVAVVKDVKLESARDPAQPRVFLLSDQPQWDLTVHGPDMKQLNQTLQQLWKAHGPRLLYKIQSVDEKLAAFYNQEQRLTTMLATIALLAIVVAMLGAYTLVADTLLRRRRELVLHRLHGAGPTDIAQQVVKEFAVPLCVAAAVALPMAGWLGQRYLAGFVDRVDNTAGLLLPILAAGVAILLVTTVAALRHVWLALELQPVEALK